MGDPSNFFNSTEFFSPLPIEMGAPLFGKQRPVIPSTALEGHKEEITSLSWRADGNVLLSASEEGAVRTWEMMNGKQVKT